MTKKELTAIVDSIVSAVVLKATEGQPDTYEPTPAEHDEARTLVGMTLKRNRQQILALVPVFAPMASAAPVAAPVAETVAAS